MGKFNKGVFLGSLLGAGFVLMSTTKKGRAVKEQLLDHAADAYVKLKNEILGSEKLKNLSKSQYVKKVDGFLREYAAEHEMAAKSVAMVKKLLISQYSKISREIKK